MNKFFLPPRYDFFNRFFQLAFVNVISNIMVPLAGLISVIFLGHLQEIYHLAGVALAVILFNYIYFLFNFLRIGSTGLTARAVGEDNREEILKVGLQNGLVALGFGIIILLLQYPVRELWFALVHATPEVKASGIDYFNARIWGAPAVLLNSVLIGWLLGREMSGKVLLISAIGNGANIFFDFLYIIQWKLSSMGAGLSQALSQYLILLVGFVLVSQDIQYKEIQKAWQTFWDWSAFKSILTLNGNIFISSFINLTAWAFFTNISATMGTNTLVEDTLLLEIVSLSVYLINGIGFATETLTGIFQGQNANDRFIPLLQIGLGMSLLVGLSIGGICTIFPDTIFGLFSNHREPIALIRSDVSWLIYILGCLAAVKILYSYFGGLTKGEPIRNASLWGGLLGFAPLAIWAWNTQSNQILWLALLGFLATRMVAIATFVLGTLQNSD